MKKTYTTILILLSILCYSQDKSPNAVIDDLLLNQSLDKIYYDKFYIDYGDPNKTTKNENGGYTSKYFFVNKENNLKQEIDFIFNDYGKITTILYHFPNLYRQTIVNKISSKLSTINENNWYNSNAKLLYTILSFSELTKIGIVPEDENVMILFITIK